MSDVIGIDVSGKVIVLHDLEAEIEAAGIPLPHGLSLYGPPKAPPTVPTPPSAEPQPCPEGTVVYTHDDQGNPADLPPGAEDIVRSYTA